MRPWPRSLTMRRETRWQRRCASSMLSGGPGVEAGCDVVVAEPGDGVFAGDDGAEQGEVGWADGVEASDVTAMVGSRSAPTKWARSRGCSSPRRSLAPTT